MRTRVCVLVMVAGVLGAPSWLGGAGVASARQGDKPAAASGQVDLRPKFKRGQEVRFEMLLDISSSQAAGDMGDLKVSTKQELGLALKVKDVTADGRATIDLVYESLKLTTDSTLAKMSFDSSQPAEKDDETGALLRPVVGLTLSLETDEVGNITSVAAPSGSGASPMLRQFTGADVVKGLFGPIVRINSGSGVASVGDTWTNESVMQGGLGAMKLRNNYTLRSCSPPRATLDISGSVSLDASAAGLATVRDGTIKGSATWNTEQGMLESMEMTQKLKVDTKLGEQTMATTQDMTVRVRRK